jgi:hypothetical protein
MTIWYGSGDDVVPLISESEIAQLFDRCADSRIIRFGVTIENKQQNNSPTTAAVDDENDQPVHAPFFAWPNQAYEGEYEDDEPVGFNEEKTYLPKANLEPEVVVARVPLGTLDVPNSYDPQHVAGDDETLLASKEAPIYIHDKKVPTIVEGATFSDSKAFKVSLRQLAIREDWSFITEHSDSKRFRGRCTDKDCPWRIHAYKIKDTNTFMVSKLPFLHTCGSVNCSKGMANRNWLADKGKAAIQEDAAVSAKQLKERLQREYDIKLGYSDVWKGRARALDELQGTYKENFQLLWSFKAELLAANPGSIFEIDVRTATNKKGDVVHYFNRLFIAFKPCIDGFLAGCRPYLGVDATFLTGKYTGQLAAAIGVDGHSWMFPVAFGIFEKENKDNWVWFMQQLKLAIGDPPGLAIHTDACKGLESAISTVYPNCEHRECMMHLMLNFKKKYKGDILDHMWPAAWTYELEKHAALMAEIEAISPAAIAFLRKEHNRVWMRSKFSAMTKVEYVSNNLAEVFNNWIREYKTLALVEFLDKLRDMIMQMREKRRTIAEGLQGYILPSVIKELNQKSKGLHYLEARASPTLAEISGNGWRHTVNLEKKECSCRRWQICGKPCTHALRFIFSKKAKLEEYVDDSFSVARFKAAYEGILMPIRGRSQWPKVNPGFDMIPPKLTRSAGRPRTRRIKNYSEGGTGRKHKCKRCGQLGHLKKTCKEAELDSDADRDATPSPR